MKNLISNWGLYTVSENLNYFLRIGCKGLRNSLLKVGIAVTISASKINWGRTEKEKNLRKNWKRYKDNDPNQALIYRATQSISMVSLCGMLSLTTGNTKAIRHTFVFYWNILILRGCYVFCSRWVIQSLKFHRYK